MFRACLVLVLLVGSGQVRADTRGTLRVGVMPLDLEASSDTPLFGASVDTAVEGYNAMAAARGTSRIDAGDLGLAETLVVLAPGVEGGTEHYFFRLEAMLGRASDLTSVGVGVYPINVQARVHRGVTGYLSIGGTASWLDRAGPGDVGGLVTGRAAVGVRLARHFVAELGYSAFALGGTINSKRLAEMSAARIDQAELENTISAGQATGLFDVSFGVTY
jgi:hypothetical protein